MNNNVQLFQKLSKTARTPAARAHFRVLYKRALTVRHRLEKANSPLDQLAKSLSNIMSESQNMAMGLQLILDENEEFFSSSAKNSNFRNSAEKLSGLLASVSGRAEFQLSQLGDAQKSVRPSLTKANSPR